MPDAKRIVLAVTLAEQGGVQEFLLRLGSFLAEQGHNVTILAGEGSWLFPLAHDRHIPIRRLTHLRRAIHPWHDLLAFFELRRVLKELQPDAIHLNSTKMGVLGSLAARSVGIKTVAYRIGGWVFLEPLSPLTRWLYLQAERLSARWKDVIICVHPEDECLAHKLNIIPRKKLTTIPNGIDLSLGLFDLFICQVICAD
jgi:glycosyltransferase involved in cell wall biosynthesis